MAKQRILLVDDHEVVARAFEVLENPLLLGEVDRHEAQADVIERVGAQLVLVLDLLEARAVEPVEPEAEALAHL